MQLYYFETMNPRKACAVAKYLGSPVEYVRIDGGKDEHKSAAHLARNPNGLVPVLVDGDVKLWESVAIMVYLATKAGSDLWPVKEPDRLVEVMRWLSWDACHFSVVTGTFYFEHVIKPMIGLGPPSEEAVADALPGFHRFAKILDDHLKNHEFVADRLSIADFALASALAWAPRMNLPLVDYPKLGRWNDSLMKIEAWRDPWPAKNS